jgi:D-alanyl-D-alanine carboxypeptidase
MKYPVWISAVLLCLLLIGCAQEPSVETTLPPETTVHPTTQPTTEPTTVPTTVPLVTGWIEEGGNRYYYSEDGIPVTGWLELDGSTYYFREDGTMATGEVIIDGTACHFTSQGKRIIMVNPWNYVPADYEPDLVPLTSAYGVQNSQVDRSCYDALIAMIDDCNKAAPQAYVVSSYRTHQQQTDNFNRKVKFYMDQGYYEETAKQQAALSIAIPGTSEHQLGLAVDIIDTDLWVLDSRQAELPAQKWLMEHSWEYGFILRYPYNKIDVTGIIYEPWHYRYVGKTVAKEIHELGICLEEYLDMLTVSVG